jgi:flagellar hook-basal body complex protein FliE
MINSIQGNLKPLELPMMQQPGVKKDGQGFGDMFSKAFKEANQALFYSGQAARVVASGGNIELHEVSIASQKAKIALHLTTQLATKITQVASQMFQMQI